MKHSTAQTRKNKLGVYTPLIKELCKVPDNRLNQGKRHSLGLVLSLVLLGLLKGKVSTQSFSDFGKYRIRWFESWFGKLEHGIPSPRTIDRALAKTDPFQVIKIIKSFLNKFFNKLEEIMSLDGKAIKAIYGCKEIVKDMISLFSSSGLIVDQEGVKNKENEITATPRLLKRQILLGTTITGDALLTQKRIVNQIINSNGNYLLPVKGNHPDLQNIIEPTFKDSLSEISSTSFTEHRQTRKVTTTISLTSSANPRP